MMSATRKRRLTKIAAGLVGAFALVTFVVPFLINVDRLRPQLESILGSSLSREVHIGRLELSLLAGGIRAQNLSIVDDPAFSTARFLECKSLGIGVSLKALVFSRKLHVTSLTLDEPQVSLVQSASGAWNFSTIGHSADSGSVTAEDVLAPSDGDSTQAFIFDQIKISNGTLVLPVTGAAEAKQSNHITLQHIDVDLRNVALDGVMSFVISGRTMDGGRIQARGQAGPVNRSAPEKTSFHAAIKVANANLALSPGLWEGSGSLGMDASVASDGSAIHSDGHARVEKLRLVPGGTAVSQPVTFSYATDYSVAKQAGVIRAGEISIGKAKAQLSGSYSLRGTAPVAHVKLSGSQLPLENVQMVLAALGIQLPTGSALNGGTVSANLSLDGRADRLVTTGNAEIDNARLQKFDLGSKLASIPGLSGLQSGADLGIVSLSSQFRVTPQDTHLSNLKSELSGIGSVTGGGDIDANNRLQFNMVAHISSHSVTRSALNVIPGLRALPNDVPFKVEGTTSLPIFLPDLSGMARSMAQNLATNAAKVGVSPTEVAANSSKKRERGIWGKLFGHKERAALTSKF
ncbi:MAG TPA: AsmA family protein [Terriglobales bacterium]|nr:AsmA family protein [Terriglobales bacterium]